MASPHDPDFEPTRILETLLRHEVDFVLIGGFAGMALGSSLPSFDVDVAYARDDENLERLAAALRELEATPRGAPPDVPFQLDSRSLKAGANFTFDTPYGALDILSDPVGAPPYRQLKGASSKEELEGLTIHVSSIDHLIAMKEATGRSKDKYMATEYRMLADEIHRREREGR